MVALQIVDLIRCDNEPTKRRIVMADIGLRGNFGRRRRGAPGKHLRKQGKFKILFMAAFIYVGVPSGKR